MNQPRIELIGVKKYYRGRLVLSIDQLCFEPGLRYALLGANGSGKTTLLRLLAGVIRPDAGEICRYGLDAEDDIGYLPQKPYVFSFSARRNLEIALPPGLTPRERKARATALLQQVGIGELAMSRGNRLSGGEGQRLAFARMLARRHKLLLLDEPTSAMDIAGNELIETRLSAYLEQSGASLIFATHALPQAERLAERAVFFHAGVPVEQGATDAVLHHSAHEACRAFLRFWQG